jgi:hypothetical protein
MLADYRGLSRKTSIPYPGKKLLFGDSNWETTIRPGIVEADMEQDYLSYLDHFTVTDNINPLSDGEIEHLAMKKNQHRKRRERNSLLCDTDWRMLQAMNTSNSEEMETLRRYRKYFRDFTYNNNWYQDIILTCQQFLELGEGKES